MPIFEFTCNACGNNRRFSALVGVVSTAAAPTCPRCGGNDLKKCVSRFARVRSDDEAIDSLADMADSVDESDPKAMRRLMKEMAQGIDEDLSGDELEAMMNESEAGEGSGEQEAGSGAE